MGCLEFFEHLEVLIKFLCYYVCLSFSVVSSSSYSAIFCEIKRCVTITVRHIGSGDLVEERERGLCSLVYLIDSLLWSI